MKTLIVDSSIIINSRLKTFISEENNQVIIYQAKSFVEAIQFYTQKKPKLVVLDSGLPGSGSVNLLEEIKRVDEKTVVIVLSLQSGIYTKQKFTAANFFLDKYYEYEKIAEHINAIEANIKKQVRL